MVLANPIIIELDMGKLEDLLERIDTLLRSLVRKTMPRSIP